MSLLKYLLAVIAVIGLTACTETLSPTASSETEAQSGIAYTYDASSQALKVTFPAGTYSYAGVPPEVHAQLEEADSKGRAYNRLIKGKYPETKLD